MVIVAKPNGIPANVGAIQCVSPPLVLHGVSAPILDVLAVKEDAPCEPEERDGHEKAVSLFAKQLACLRN